MRIGRGVFCVNSLANIRMVQFTLVGALPLAGLDGRFGWMDLMDGKADKIKLID